MYQSKSVCLFITLFSSVVATCVMAWAVYSSSNLFFCMSAIIQISVGNLVFLLRAKDDREGTIVCCAIIAAAMMLTASVANYFFFEIIPSHGEWLAWVIILTGFTILINNLGDDLK